MYDDRNVLYTKHLNIKKSSKSINCRSVCDNDNFWFKVVLSYLFSFLTSLYVSSLAFSKIIILYSSNTFSSQFVISYTSLLKIS